MTTDIGVLITLIDQRETGLESVNKWGQKIAMQLIANYFRTVYISILFSLTPCDNLRLIDIQQRTPRDNRR